MQQEHKPGPIRVSPVMLVKPPLDVDAEDYISLPECLADKIPVALEATAQERGLLLQADGATVTAGTAAVLNTKLMQLCSNAAYDNTGGVVEIRDCSTAEQG